MSYPLWNYFGRQAPWDVPWEHKRKWHCSDHMAGQAGVQWSQEGRQGPCSLLSTEKALEPAASPLGSEPVDLLPWAQKMVKFTKANTRRLCKSLTANQVTGEQKVGNKAILQSWIQRGDKCRDTNLSEPCYSTSSVTGRKNRKQLLKSSVYYLAPLLIHPIST